MNTGSELRELLLEAADQIDVSTSLPDRIRRRIRTRRVGFISVIVTASLIFVAGSFAAMGQFEREDTIMSPAERPEEKEPTGPTPDAMVAYDGEKIMSTIPRRWRAGRELNIDTSNRSDSELFHIALGKYVKGFDREDLLSFARRAPERVATGQSPAQDYGSSQHKFTGAGRQVFTFDLDPGRYWVIAWGTSGSETDPSDLDYVLEVLSDLVVKR